MPQSLKIGLPKGSLQDSTLDMFRRAGYRITVRERSLFPAIDDENLSIIMFRAQEMSRYVEEGVVDCGITGIDWIRENNSEVHELSELVYSKATHKPARWVLAVPSESDIQRPEDLEGKAVATELTNVTRAYFAERGINCRVEFSWGATEVKARLLDGIVEITETGSSLRANSLRIVDEIMISTPRLIANHTAWADADRRQRMENLALLLRGAIEAREKVGLKFNLHRDLLPDIVKILPSEKSPTVSPLYDDTFVAVEVVVDESIERDLITTLIRSGASGLTTYPLNRVLRGTPGD